MYYVITISTRPLGNNNTETVKVLLLNCYKANL